MGPGFLTVPLLYGDKVPNTTNNVQGLDSKFNRVIDLILHKTTMVPRPTSHFFRNIKEVDVFMSTAKASFAVKY